MPGKTLAIALVAAAVVGTIPTHAGPPDLAPLHRRRLLAILGDAMVSRLVVNDALKVALIRRRASTTTRG